MSRARRDRDEPRGITSRLAEGVEATPRASELVNALPESNTEGAEGVRVVEATRTAPGDTAVVENPAELLEHTDDDSHVRVTVREGGEVEPELVEREPVEPLREVGERVEGAPVGSPPAPLDGPPEVEPVDNGPGSEGSLDADAAVDADDGTTGGGLTATAGKPGSYTPDVHGDDRPSSIAELNEQVDLGDAEAWPEGTWLPYGSGKRAHWHGAGWATGESPGYTA